MQYAFKKTLQYLLFLFLTLILMSCSSSKSSSPKPNNSTPPSAIPQHTDDTSTADKLILPDTDLAFDPALIDDHNSFEHSNDNNSSVEKTFVIHPSLVGQLNLGINFQTLDGRLAVPLYAFKFIDQNNQTMQSKSGPTGEQQILVKASEVYRFKIKLISKKMKITIVPRLVVLPTSNEKTTAPVVQQKNWDFPKTLTCIAKEQLSDSPVVSIKIDLTPPLFVSLKSINNDLIFNIGRFHVGGDKIEASDSDFQCENNIEYNTHSFSYEYVCRFYITDERNLLREIYHRTSRLTINESGNGQACKVIGQDGSQCWELNNCKAIQ
jgi:hypothetical protein